MKLVQDPKVAAQAFEAGETDSAPIKHQTQLINTKR